MTKQRSEHREKLREALANRGQRFTRQREGVFEALSATDQHPTAEEVYRKVNHTLPSVSLATVYKVLDALVCCGLAQKLTSGDGSARYDAAAHEHLHMRDVSTGRVLDVPLTVAEKLSLALPSPVAIEIEQQTGFRVTGLRVELLGHIGTTAAS